MIKIKRKKVLIIFAAAIMLFGVGTAYAYVKTQTKPKKPLIKEAEAKKVEMDLPAVQNVQIADAQRTDSVDTKSQDATALAVVSAVQAAPVQTEVKSSYPIHRNISTTYFWVGEEAGKDNKNISNLPSAWDDDWAKHFGGVDDPKRRNGLVVASFTPKENSFYFALPYNDFDENGSRKKDVGKVIPWANSKKWGASESMLKNQWIEIAKGEKKAYAQWQDVGPFGEDDSAYVFGNKAPKSRTNQDAGLDVSPAVKDFLGLGDVDRADWRFVSEDQIPAGPWKKTLTRSQIYWN